jgi:hypothetical protein
MIHELYNEVTPDGHTLQVHARRPVNNPAPQALRDLRTAGVEIVTFGQVLPPGLVGCARDCDMRVF